MTEPLDFKNLTFTSYVNLTPQNIVEINNIDNIVALGTKLVELRASFVIPSTYLMATIAARAAVFNYPDIKSLFPRNSSASWRSKLLNIGNLLLKKPFLYRHCISAAHTCKAALNQMTVWAAAEDEDHLAQICKLCKSKGPRRRVLANSPTDDSVAGSPSSVAGSPSSVAGSRPSSRGKGKRKKSCQKHKSNKRKVTEFEASLQDLVALAPDSKVPSIPWTQNSAALAVKLLSFARSLGDEIPAGDNLLEALRGYLGTSSPQALDPDLFSQTDSSQRDRSSPDLDSFFRPPLPPEESFSSLCSGASDDFVLPPNLPYSQAFPEFND
jgi:hypothetical protein